MAFPDVWPVARIPPGGYAANRTAATRPVIDGTQQQDSSFDREQAMSNDALPLAGAAALAATESRIKQLFASETASDGRESIAPAGSGSARDRARKRLRANSREAIAARLRRKVLESGFLKVVTEAASAAGPPEPDATPTDAEIALGLERIIGRNELLGVQYLEEGFAASDPSAAF